MSTNPVVTPPQNPGAGVPTPGNGTLTEEQIKDLQFKASQSSQNFERAKKLEEKIQELSTTIETLEGRLALSNQYSDEGITLKNEIESLRGTVVSLQTTIGSLQGDHVKKEIFSKFPVVEDKWTEFEEFWNLSENKGMSMMTAAKAFVFEKDLVPPPTRKGLEGPSSAGFTTPTGKMSAEDARLLRENNYEQYRKLLMEGKIEVSG